MLGGASINFIKQSAGQLQVTSSANIPTIPKIVGKEVFVTDASKVGEVVYNNDGSVQSSTATGAICVYDGYYWFNTFINQYLPLDNFAINRNIWNTMKANTSMYSSYLGDPSPNDIISTNASVTSGIRMLASSMNEITQTFPAPINSGWIVMEYAQETTNHSEVGGSYATEETDIVGPAFSVTTDNNVNVTIAQSQYTFALYINPSHNPGYTLPNGSIINDNDYLWQTRITRKIIYKIYSSSDGLMFDLFVTDDSGNIIASQIAYDVPGAKSIVSFDIGSLGHLGSGPNDVNAKATDMPKTILLLRHVSSDPTNVPYSQLLTMN